jgi:regulator of replication initiation timing
MNDHLDKINDKMTDIAVNVAVMQADIAEIKKDLNRHVVRSDRLEEDNKLRAQELSNRVSPIEQHIAMLHSWKVGVALVGAVALWVTNLLSSLGVFK